jgi:hypothetical protein
MIVAFVGFKDDNGKDLNNEGFYAVFDNGMIRSATPVEFGELRAEGGPYAKAPIRREPASETSRYAAYDNALRG